MIRPIYISSQNSNQRPILQTPAQNTTFSSTVPEFRGFQAMLTLDSYGMTFNAVVVIVYLCYK